MTGWTIGLGLTQTAAAIPNLADYGRSLIFDPGIGPRERMQAARYVGFPNAEREVKIVLTIVLRRSVSEAHFRRVRSLLRESPKGLQDDYQDAHQEISLSLFELVHYQLLQFI